MHLPRLEQQTTCSSGTDTFNLYPQRSAPNSLAPLSNHKKGYLYVQLH